MRATRGGLPWHRMRPPSRWADPKTRFCGIAIVRLYSSSTGCRTCPRPRRTIRRPAGSHDGTPMPLGPARAQANNSSDAASADAHNTAQIHRHANAKEMARGTACMVAPLSLAPSTLVQNFQQRMRSLHLSRLSDTKHRLSLCFARGVQAAAKEHTPSAPSRGRHPRTDPTLRLCCHPHCRSLQRHAHSPLPRRSPAQPPWAAWPRRPGRRGRGS